MHPARNWPAGRTWVPRTWLDGTAALQHCTAPSRRKIDHDTASAMAGAPWPPTCPPAARQGAAAPPPSTGTPSGHARWCYNRCMAAVCGRAALLPLLLRALI